MIIGDAEIIIDFSIKKTLNKILYRMNTILMILCIVLNMMICFVLIYYGNILAFLFIVNVYYIISYYRLIKKERLSNELG